LQILFSARFCEGGGIFVLYKMVQGYRIVPILDKASNEGDIVSVCASPTGDVSAVGRRISASQHVLQLWDPQSGHLMRSMEGHTDSLTPFSFSDDGKRLVSGSIDKTVRVWDLSSSQSVQVLSGHTERVSGVSISGDGKLCASGSWDETIRVWDVDSGRVLKVLNLPSSSLSDGISICAIVMSRDGNVVVSGSSDTNVMVWDVATGAAPLILVGHTSAVYGLDTSHDGKRIVSGASDGTMRIWDASTGKEIRQIKGCAYSWHAVSMSLDGKFVGGPGADGRVCIWEVGSGRVCADVQVEGGVKHAHVSFAGKVIAAVSRNTPSELQIWKATP